MTSSKVTFTFRILGGWGGGGVPWKITLLDLDRSQKLLYRSRMKHQKWNVGVNFSLFFFLICRPNRQLIAKLHLRLCILTIDMCFVFSYQFYVRVNHRTDWFFSISRVFNPQCMYLCIYLIYWTAECTANQIDLYISYMSKFTSETDEIASLI